MIRTMLAACVTATFMLVANADAGTGRQTRAEARAYELSLKQPAPASNLAPLDTVSYSDTTVGGVTWNRPFADCTGQSSLGPVTLHVQNFSVDQTGSYSLSSVQTGFDGFVFIYTEPFVPTSPNSGCVAGNDDGAGGIGTSDLTTTLTAGVPYVVVTTAFEAGEEGTFTNTLSGPGLIALGGAGERANLGVTKTAPGGVATGGSYAYQLGASNAGPDDATAVIVTDVLPAGITFVSSTCGATASGQTVTWSIGNLANGGTASCELTVNNASATCSAVSNTATISGAELDPVSGNNSSTHTNGGGEQVVDGGFEAANAPAWTQTSSNFGSPLCDAVGCGTGGGTAGPFAGSQWMWFGGAGTNPETGSAGQSITIPAGATSLTFQYWLGACGTGGANDFIRLTIDGTEVWRRDATSAECAASGYTQASIDVSSFAGGTRAVLFESTSGTAGDNSNFHIDNVSLSGSPTCSAGAVPITIIPTAGGTVACTPNPVTPGGTSTCTATPNPGQTFTSWTAGCSGTNPVCTLTNVTAPVTVQAAFGAGPGGPAAVALPVSSTWLMVLLSGLLGFVGLRYLRPATRR